MITSDVIAKDAIVMYLGNPISNNNRHCHMNQRLLYYIDPPLHSAYCQINENKRKVPIS